MPPVPGQETRLGPLVRPSGERSGVTLDRVEDGDHASGEGLTADLGEHLRLVDAEACDEGPDSLVVVIGQRLGDEVRVGARTTQGQADNAAGLRRFRLGRVGQSRSQQFLQRGLDLVAVQDLGEPVF